MRVHISAAVALAAVAGCSAKYRTEHLRIEPHFDYPLCEGNLQSYEDQISEYEELLGHDLDAPLDVDVWPPHDWPNHSFWKCGNTTWRGCYKRSSHRIYAEFNSQVILHELVHAVVRSSSSSDPLFTEGLAEALSRSTEFGFDAPTLEQNEKDLDYRTAGHFVRWLLEEHGLDCVKGVLGSKGNDVSGDFRSSCGESFGDAVSKYSTSAPWFYPSPLLCGANAVSPQNGELIMSVDFDCDAVDVVANGPSLAVSRVLHIESPGRYHIWTSAPGFTLGSCEREIVVDAPQFYSQQDTAIPPHWAAPSRSYPGNRVYTLELPAGDIEFTIFATWDDDPIQEVIVTSAGPDLPFPVR